MKKPAKSSRSKFLGAGLVVGGALYADPAKALAATGGHPIVLGGEYVPETVAIPGKTPIEKLVGDLPDNTGTLTLKDLAGLGTFNVQTIEKMYPKYANLTYNDLSSIIGAVVAAEGGDTLVFNYSPSGGYEFACCCCSCCCTINGGVHINTN